jgi:lipopolysaccharide transport system ATP-binding protein
MPDPALRVRSLKKVYRIFDSPRARLREALHPFGRRLSRDFHALRGLDFEIPCGQAVGVVGRNGSGKSTLLQILAGVLPPSSGTVERAGTIAALLELGTGFDPELTGRQNVVLHGALVGRRAAETRARLAEIESFADIGAFIDQPVRTYSSGMFARLAFATAIHIDPEILLVDEILAVGDACFQQRCFEWLAGFRRRGKTLVLVSHDLESIVSHCDRALLLEEGRLLADGEPRAVANRYAELLFRSAPAVAAASAPSGADRRADDALASFCATEQADDGLPASPFYNAYESTSGGAQVRITDVYVSDAVGAQPLRFVSGCPVDVHVKLHRELAEVAFEFGFGLYAVDGAYAYGTTTEMRPDAFERRALGKGEVVRFGLSLALRCGHYFLDLAAFQTRGGEPYYLNMRRRCLHFEVTPTPHFDGLTDLAPRGRGGA